MRAIRITVDEIQQLNSFGWFIPINCLTCHEALYCDFPVKSQTRGSEKKRIGEFMCLVKQSQKKNIYIYISGTFST